MTDWIEWKGGECPVAPYAEVCIRMRDGEESTCSDYASSLRWDHTGSVGDIIAYRLHNPAAAETDLVNNPPHYKHGAIECIDIIKAALTEDEFRGYCKGNALKYIYRERHKGGDESLKKAIWYLDRLTK